MSLSSLKNRAAAQNGFSLIELLVVVLIIGILAAIMIPRFLGQRDNANNSQAQSAVRNAASAAEAYYQKNGESYGTAAGLRTAITTSEKDLTTAAGAPSTGTSGNALVGNSGADPKRIWVDVSGATRDDNATICAVGKGDRAYCMIIDGNAATIYGKSPTSIAGAATDTSGWNG